MHTLISPIISNAGRILSAGALTMALMALPFTALQAQTCNNVVNGGTIAANEFGCPNPTWDPSLIVSLTLPTGGSGALEFVWIFTTDDPTNPFAQWVPIPNTNSPEYDPGPISVTTHYRRCARRFGCSDYVGETNIITKEALCCDNVTDGGQIGQNQSACQAPLDPALLVNVTPPSGGSNVLEYQWVISTTGTPYTATNPDWTFIAGANAADFDPAALSVTTYFIRLSRRHGCTDYDGVSNMVTISISDGLSAFAEQKPVTCFGGSDGAIDLTVSGGQTPFSFVWTAPLANVEDPQSVQAGTYSVTVTDANGCTTTASVTVEEGDEIILTVQSSDETCLGAANGEASVSNVTGGHPSYTYAWGSPLNQTTSQVTDLAAGGYSVTVTDTLGCTASASVAIDAGVSLVVTVSATNAICFGDNQGSATVQNTTGGSGNYTYQWNDPASSTLVTASNLTVGTYTVTVTDDQGCTGSASATVADGPQIILSTFHTDATCNYSTDGSATVQVSGGTSPFAYNWNDSGWQTTATAIALAA
ncbi:MAG: SprB repeat-containing protein, partial [Bacteroidetes bacterium]|nr:SprB repeat-containing protein [Bacteroidota bacterium]